MTVKGQTTADVGPSFRRSFSGLKGIGGLVVFFFRSANNKDMAFDISLILHKVMGTITVNFDIIGYLPMKMKNGNQPHRGVSQWFDFSGFNGCGTRYPLYWLYCRDIPVWRLNLGVAYHVNENMYMCANVKPKCRWHLHVYMFVNEHVCAYVFADVYVYMNSQIYVYVRI